MQDNHDDINALKAEIERLRTLLDANGIDWRPRPVFTRSDLSLEERVNLFRSLFRGREDVFARRWESRNSGKSGYQPVCRREWQSQYCDKKKYKCAECPNREFEPLAYKHIYRHLEGRDPDCRDVVGLYAITANDGCNFLCADFDDKSCEHGYQNDVKAYIAVCRDWDIPAYTERSRSGNGAHVWIFFAEEVKARDARRLGNAILTEAMERDGRMSFKSYDRLFPNQDTMPTGGFGNLVALPLQGRARKNGNSVFVNDDFKPYADQWRFLQSVKKMTVLELAAAISSHCAQEPMGALSKTSESAPWERPTAKSMSKAEFPTTIKLVLANGIYIPLKGLSAKSVNHLKRIAAFRNPEFYAKLGMRLPTYNIPRIISCSELTDDYLLMPRGCYEDIVQFFELHGTSVSNDDKRTNDTNINVSFNGTLRPEQGAAVEELMRHNTGVIHATTAFGKTVAGIALIARRKVNTLILVHTKALLDQWRRELEKFLVTDFQPPEQRKGPGRKKKFRQFGALCATENSLNGKIDVALIQSCLDDETEAKRFVKDYGMVIVDECHHISAVNFERVLRQVNARYVYGLSATPIRKDGHQPIIFMQCGPIRYTSDAKTQIASQSFRRILIPRFTAYRSLTDEKRTFTKVAASLAEDEQRNHLIADDVKTVLDEGRSPIILTKFKEHVSILAEKCKRFCPNIVTLVGTDSAKVKRETLMRLNKVKSDELLIVIATGQYVGEGFDLPRLDTLFLATPNSWKGLIAQYAGRLHREYPGKKEVRIYDYVDLHEPICESMYRKRLAAYKQQGYALSETSEGLFAEPVTQAIFGADDFEIAFLNDLASARLSIVISCHRLKWKRHPRLVDLLQNKLHQGIAVTIVIHETGHNEPELSTIGVRIISSPATSLNCAVIDNTTGWYGSVNFCGRTLPDATAIRLQDSYFCASLIDCLLQ